MTASSKYGGVLYTCICGVCVFVCVCVCTTAKAKELYATEKAMAPHSSTLAWKIPWMEEPGGLQSMGLLKVGHN